MHIRPHLTTAVLAVMLITLVGILAGRLSADAGAPPRSYDPVVITPASSSDTPTVAPSPAPSQPTADPDDDDDEPFTRVTPKPHDFDDDDFDDDDDFNDD